MKNCICQEDISDIILTAHSSYSCHMTSKYANNIYSKAYCEDNIN